MMNGRADMLAALPGGRLLAEFSLWSADLVRMADDVARVDEYVDIYHADVADGHFSPAMLLFPDLIAQIRLLTDKLVHVHLMVADTALMGQIDQFAEAGAEISFRYMLKTPMSPRLSIISAARDWRPASSCSFTRR